MGSITENLAQENFDMLDPRIKNLWQKYYSTGNFDTPNQYLSRVLSLYQLRDYGRAYSKHATGTYEFIHDMQIAHVSVGGSLERFARAFIKDLD